MREIKITPCITERTKLVEKYLKEVNRLRMITPEEETELAVRITEGDDSAREELVKANLRFAISIAKQFQGRGMELGDLISEANMGLIKAASRYDPTRGFKFISYAVWWIRQGILDAISRNGRMVRLPLNKVSEINKAYRLRNEFLQNNGREPSDLELAELSELDPTKLADSISLASGAVSLDKPLGDDGENTMLDLIAEDEAQPADSGLVKESLSQDIQDVMRVLSVRERQILTMMYGIGCAEKSVDEIGEIMHLTKERIRQVRQNAVRKLSRPGIRERLVQYI